jgi:hypothetical protein
MNGRTSQIEEKLNNLRLGMNASSPHYYYYYYLPTPVASERTETTWMKNLRLELKMATSMLGQTAQIAGKLNNLRLGLCS